MSRSPAGIRDPSRKLKNDGALERQSVFGFSTALLQPFMAALSDKIGYFKRILQVGLLFMGAATLAFVFVGKYIDILVLRID